VRAVKRGAFKRKNGHGTDSTDAGEYAWRWRTCSRYPASGYIRENTNIIIVVVENVEAWSRRYSYGGHGANVGYGFFNLSFIFH
jgi:hypothetical protein